MCACTYACVHVCAVHSCECMCSCLGVYMEVKGQLSRVKFQETSNSDHVTCVAGARWAIFASPCTNRLKKYGVSSLSNGQALKNFGLGSDLKQLEMLLAASWGSMAEQTLVLPIRAKRQKAMAYREARQLGWVSSIWGTVRLCLLEITGGTPTIS